MLALSVTCIIWMKLCGIWFSISSIWYDTCAASFDAPPIIYNEKYESYPTQLDIEHITKTIKKKLL